MATAALHIAFDDRTRVQPLVIGALGRDGLRLEYGGSSVLLRPDGIVEVEDPNGNALSLAPAGIAITASAKVTVAASQVEVSAATVTVNAGMSRFSGAVQCETLIANSVVASSYTPGAGNVL